MTNIIGKIELPTNASAQIAKGMVSEGSRILSRRVFAKARIISREIGNLLVKKFEASEVAKALRGQGIEDLPAHFGLSDTVANSLVDGMSEIIRLSVSLSSKGSNEKIVILIRAVEDKWEKYFNLPGAEYISSQSGITIPVIKWLLIDPNIDIGQAAYNIVFLGDSTKFDAQIQKVSRSGRAIMVAINSFGGSGGYVLPNIVSGQVGGNFIEYALGQNGVITEVASILLKRIR